MNNYTAITRWMRALLTPSWLKCIVLVLIAALSVGAVVVTRALQAHVDLEHWRRSLVTFYVRRCGAQVRQPGVVNLCMVDRESCPPAVLSLLHRPIVDVRVSHMCSQPQVRKILRACRWYAAGDVLSLNFIRVPLTADISEAVGCIDGLDDVTLEECGLDDDLLGMIGQRAKIGGVCVNGNPVDGRGFAQWKYREEVLYLHAARTKITDDSAAYLRLLPNVVFLDLSLTAIGDDACQVLAQLPKLKMLLINGTDVGDQGLMQLASSRSLNCIFAICTNVSEAGASQYRKLRPDAGLYTRYGVDSEESPAGDEDR